MQPRTTAKIIELMSGELTPLAVKRTKLALLKEELNDAEQALNEIKRKVAQAQVSAESEFESLIELIKMSGIMITKTEGIQYTKKNLRWNPARSTVSEEIMNQLLRDIQKAIIEDDNEDND